MPARVSQGASVPRWLRLTIASCLAFLAFAGVCWLVGQVLMRLALLSFTLAVAVLLTALLTPLAVRMRRAGVPAAVPPSCIPQVSGGTTVMSTAEPTDSPPGDTGVQASREARLVVGRIAAGPQSPRSGRCRSRSS